MVLSINGLPPNHPKSSISIDGFSRTNHPFGGTPISGNPHIHGLGMSRAGGDGAWRSRGTDVALDLHMPPFFVKSTNTHNYFSKCNSCDILFKLSIYKFRYDVRSHSFAMSLGPHGHSEEAAQSWEPEGPHSHRQGCRCQKSGPGTPDGRNLH